MTLFAVGVAFVLVWSALIWGIATSDLRSDKSFLTRPAFWQANILAIAIPAVFLLLYALLPAGVRPEITLLEALRTPAAAATMSTAPQVAVTATPIVPHTDLFNLLAPVLMIVYGAGAGLFLLRFVLGKRRSREIVASAEFAADRAIWVTAEKVPPFALGGTAPKVVFPQYLLDSLGDDQIAMVIRHERAHIENRDPFWADTFFFLRAALWFSPFVRDLIRRWQLAVELRADAVALSGRPVEVRKSYAQSLITAIRVPVTASPVPLAAFTGRHLSGEKTRIKNIMNGDNDMTNLMQGNFRFLLAASVLALVGCTSAAGVTSAVGPEADERELHVLMHDGEFNGEHDKELHMRVHKGAHGDAQREVRVVRMIDGERVEMSYDELSPEEQAEIDRELARAELEMERAMKEMDLAEIEMDKAEIDMQRVLRFERKEIDADIDIDREQLEAELARAKEQIEEARVEIRVQREKLAEDRERLIEERERLREEADSD